MIFLDVSAKEKSMLKIDFKEFVIEIKRSILFYFIDYTLYI